MRGARTIALLTATVAALTLAPHQAAPAAGAEPQMRSYERSRLPTSRGLNRPAEFGRATLLRSGPLLLAAGQSRHLRGHLEALNRGWVAEQRAVVRCHDADGREVSRTTTSRNHDGATAPRRLDESAHGIGRIGYPSRGVLAIEVNHLLVALREGVYTCRLDGEANPKGRTSKDKLIALKHTTWLDVSRAVEEHDHGNAIWHAGADAGSTFDGPCDAVGEWSTCRYVVPAATRTAYPCPSRYTPWARAFDGMTDRWNPVAVFTPSMLASHVDVVAEVELTNCNGSASCTTRLRRCGERKGSAHVKTRLELVPVSRDEDGNLKRCGTPVYDPPSSYHTKRITPATHHFKMHHRGRIAVDRSGACGLEPLILIRIAVGAAKGNPTKIDGARMTSAIAMNAA